MNIGLIRKFLLPIVALVLMFSSCKEAKNVIYLKEVETLPVEMLSKSVKPEDVKIIKGDDVYIKVESDDSESVAVFNKVQASVTTGGESSAGASSINEEVVYRVDNDGFISFPIIGKINLSGLTLYEAEKLIASKIYPEYVKKEPVVTVRIKNFRITVLGEVSNPGVINIETERVNILELLAQAGDLSITGRRDNVLLIRVNEDGSKEIFRYDLNDKYLLFSPYFYLKQNDIVYVEQNRSKTRSAYTIPSIVTFSVGLLSTSISVANLIITLSNKF